MSQCSSARRRASPHNISLRAMVAQALIASSLLMLLVLVLRDPVRRAFGPSVAYALWALPVLRLFLPPLPGDWRLSQLIAPAVSGKK